MSDKKYFIQLHGLTYKTLFTMAQVSAILSQELQQK
jgi:hypothetical protein